MIRAAGTRAEPRSAVGPGSADEIVVLFPAAGRKRRLVEAGEGAYPREFFYGALDLAGQGMTVRYADTRRAPDGALGRAHLLYERARNRVSGFGLSRQRVAALRGEITGAALAISFTDGFSLSLGRHRGLLAPGTRLVGGFHGLADMPNEVAAPFRPWAHSQIRKGVAGLDHLFFFGEADRREAIRRFAIPEGKTSLFLFGVDTDFWHPGGTEVKDHVLSVGSDPKRDYTTLLAAPVPCPIHIVTRLKVEVPAGRPDVEIIRGSYHQVAVTDRVLRDLYREAAIVVVPLRDVFQPTGYSATLQAMACGKAVILSRIKGLWDPELFVSGENCLLVEPGNPRALAEQIMWLRADSASRRRLGAAARATAERFFALPRMNDSLATLVTQCLVPAAET